MPAPLLAVAAVPILTKLVIVGVGAGLLMFFADLEAWAWYGINLIVEDNLDDSISRTGSLPATMPAWFWWVAHLVRLWDGLEFLIGCATIGFLIRRVPVIG